MTFLHLDSRQCLHESAGISRGFVRLALSGTGGPDGLAADWVRRRVTNRWRQPASGPGKMMM